MPVLDTFYIVFKSFGAKDVKKDQEEVAQSTDSVASAFEASARESKKASEGLKKTGDEAGKTTPKLVKNKTTIDQVTDSFKQLGKQFLGVATAAVSAYGIFEGFKSAVGFATDLDTASRLLQVNTMDLDAWGNAVQKTGGNAQAFQQSLSNLSQNLWVTGETALKVLPQLADSFQKMGRNAALRYGGVLGLDPGTINLLLQGRKGVEALLARQKELGVVTAKDAKAARDFNFAWQDTTHALRMAFLNAAVVILPTITKIITAFGGMSEYVSHHSNLIIGALIGVGTAVFALSIPFIVAAAPVLLLTAAIGAAIAVFALLFDDVATFIKGGDSMIGQILQKWPLIGETVRAIKKDFDDLFYSIDRAYSKYFKFMSGGKDFKIGGEFGDGSNVDDQFSAPTIGDNVASLQNAWATMGNSPLAAQTSTSISNSSTANSVLNRGAGKNYSINTGPISIQTQAVDASGIAESLSQTLNEHLKQTINNFDDGISA